MKRRPSLTRTVAVGLVLAMLLACACDEGETERTPPARAHHCPERAPAPRPLPGVRPEQERAQYWIDRLDDGDRPVLLPEQIDELHDHWRASSPAELTAETRQRLESMASRTRSGKLVDAAGKPLSGREVEMLQFTRGGLLADARTHLALERTPVRCAPYDGPLHSRPVDTRYDRNRCTTVEPQEPITLFGRWANGMWLVRAGPVLGWIEADPPLSPALSSEQARLLDEPRLRVLRPLTVQTDGGPIALTPGMHLLGDGAHALLGVRAHLAWLPRPAGVERTRRALTRRALIEQTFLWHGQPYGWGDAGGGHDCSGLVLDVFTSFDLRLPRNSQEQALAGTEVLDVGDASSHAKAALVAGVSGKAVVLLHLPGHIMVHLGHEKGRHYVLHALSGYLEPCEGKGETERVVDRVVVSDLSLGTGSTKGSLLERIDQITVFRAP